MSRLRQHFVVTPAMPVEGARLLREALEFKYDVVFGGKGWTYEDVHDLPFSEGDVDLLLELDEILAAHARQRPVDRYVFRFLDVNCDRFPLPEASRIVGLDERFAPC